MVNAEFTLLNSWAKRKTAHSSNLGTGISFNGTTCDFAQSKFVGMTIKFVGNAYVNTTPKWLF